MSAVLIVILQALYQLVRLYMTIILVYTIFTWVPFLYQSVVGRFLGKIVDPFLNIFDRFIPPIAGLSFSPVIAFFILYLIDDHLLLPIIYRLAGVY